MKSFLALLLVTVFSVSGTALAGSVSAGQTAYAAKGCIGCHGPGGKSMVATYPSLKGRDEAFIQTTLTDFRSGKRKNATMNAMAAGLSDADIENLASYINSLK